MANKLLNCWTSTNTTEENAHMLADSINGGLSKENELSVVKITDNWYMIVGNEHAKKWYDEFTAALIEHQKNKQQK